MKTLFSFSSTKPTNKNQDWNTFAVNHHAGNCSHCAGKRHHRAGNRHHCFCYCYISWSLYVVLSSLYMRFLHATITMNCLPLSSLPNWEIIDCLEIQQTFQHSTVIAAYPFVIFVMYIPLESTCICTCFSRLCIFFTFCYYLSS